MEIQINSILMCHQIEVNVSLNQTPPTSITESFQGFFSSFNSKMFEKENKRWRLPDMSSENQSAFQSSLSFFTEKIYSVNLKCNI